MRIRAFRAWRPAAGLEAEIASPPYDVVDRPTAARLAEGRLRSFLRVSRADLEFPDSVPSTADVVYGRAAANWAAFCRHGWARQDDEPGILLYRQRCHGHSQTGVVAVYHTADYEAGVIRRHEHTRREPEEDRARHIAETGIQSGPVFLMFRDGGDVTNAIERIQANTPPLWAFVADDGVEHVGWRVPEPAAMIRAFERVPHAYIADGHHRAAAAARVAREMAGGTVDPSSDDESAWVMAVWFPAAQLRILPYNRAVAGLGGWTPETFLAAVRTRMSVVATDGPEPSRPGEIRMGLAGRWYGLAPLTPPDPKDRAAALDVSVLQVELLGPLLGITDPRRDPRIAFIGGRDSVAELSARLRNGTAAVVFSLWPVSTDAIMDVADAGGVMPPKSTWFDPKLRSGLFVHAIR